MIQTVIFDIGGVLIDWDPRHLYRKLFDDEAAMERFLAEICTAAWNYTFDLGHSMKDGVAALAKEHPDQADRIEAYYTRWPEMVAGAIDGTPAILAALKARGVGLYALSNFSMETFPHARARFDFLGEFEGLVISGEEGVAKPDRRIYDLILARYGLDPAACLFIDDVPANVEAARAVGIDAVQFTGSDQLNRDLQSRGLDPA